MPVLNDHIKPRLTMANLVPYREPAIVPSSFETMGIGLLFRNSPKHKCTPPSFFKCLFNGIKVDDLWFCPCGNGTFRRFSRFRWSGNWYDNSVEDVQATCKRRGIEFIENPYRKEA